MNEKRVVYVKPFSFFYIFETKRFHMKRDVFQAIADPTRREIISMLSKNPQNVNHISEQFQMSRTGVSKHMKILKECGLLFIEKKGREHYCHVKLEPLSEIENWVGQYRTFWNDRLDKLEVLIRKENNEQKKE